MLRVPLPNTPMLNVPDNHIADGLKKITAKRVDLQTLVTYPKRLKYVLHHLLAVFAYRNALPGIPIQLRRIPMVNHFKCKLVAGP